jgi:TPR repeat protein
MSDYESQKSQYRSELEAYEGEGPANANQLWYVARAEAQSAADWIEDMPVTESEIQTAKGDVLKALVALEMAEELIDE